MPQPSTTFPAERAAPFPDRLTTDQRSLLQRFVADPEAVVSSGNVAGWLFRHAAQFPQRTAVLEPRTRRGKRTYAALSFFQLLASVQRYVLGLHKAGIRRGTRVVLMVPPSRELTRLVYALLQVGAVPVLVDPGMGVAHLGRCLAEAQPEAFIGIPKAHMARWCLGWGRPTLRTCIVAGTGRWSPFGLATAAFSAEPAHGEVPFCFPQPDDPAAILFTSGSTGVPKGAVYTHGIFAAQVEQLRQIFGIEAGEVDLCTFPLFALFAPALGMTSVIPRMDFTRPARVSPPEIWEPARQFRVTNLFGSPALLDRVGRAAAAEPEETARETGKLPSIRRVLTAGAPVAPQILERFVRLLEPTAKIFTPYGATEALPVAVIDSDEVLRDTRRQTEQGAGTCVGRPVPQIEVRIIRLTDEPIACWSDELVLPPGEIGEIAVYGPVVTQAYFRRPDLTALAKIPDPQRGKCWHRMGDVGYFDAQGRLWFCGRKSQRVVTPQRTYFTDPVEGVFNAHPAVFRTALVGVTRRGVTTPVLCVEREQPATALTEDQLTNELLALGAQFEHTRDIRIILYKSPFPVDIRHNSKIFREQLVSWAAQHLAQRAETPPSPHGPTEGAGRN
jgi:acyl-CoA synthetase (AMP-forming)/AMP-acid ligase II